MFNTFRVVMNSLAALCVVTLVNSIVVTTIQAQNFQFGNNVGGVRVETSGVLSLTPTVLDAALHQMLIDDVKPTQGLFADGKGLRKLSLKRLNQVVAQAVANGQPIPAQARYLAGLVRIEYVFVDQNNNDLVIAGPAEELVVNKRGNVVGAKSGKPALHLEDLMTALQTVDAATTGQGISVSIEPSDESRVAFRNITASAEQTGGVNGNLINQLEQAMGPQSVLLTGVPKNSRYANVLALADYKMKRLSMGLEQSPLKKLPSFVSMLTRSTTLSSMTPRFWMEMDYNPMSRSEDGNIWKLDGQGVKTLTEDDFVKANGETNASGRTNPVAAKWAKAMTENYSDLVNEESIFGELRNLFDMSVISAVIEKEQLISKSGLKMDALLGKIEGVDFNQWNVPTQVPTVASLVTYRRGTIVTASGGVQLDPWSVVSSVKVDQNLNQFTAQLSGSDGSKLFWN